MKKTFDTARRLAVDIEFREYRPPAISAPLRNYIPSPPRVESSPLAAIYPQDLDREPSCLEKVEPPWRVRDGKRR